MDERVAIYFHFPTYVVGNYQMVNYMVGPWTSGPCPPDNDIASVTLRELVALMCWRALREMGGRLNEFTQDRRGRVEVDESSRPVLYFGSTSSLRKRPWGEISGRDPRRRRLRLKSGERANEPATTFESFWAEGSSVTLRFIADPSLEETKRDKMLEPGSPERDSPPRNLRPSHPPPLDPGEERTCTLRVMEVVNKAVVILSSPEDPTRLWIAKFFADDETSHAFFVSELEAYTTARTLQGCEIPHMYGVWHPIHHSNPLCVILLTEYISPGTTISEISCDAHAAIEQQREVGIARLDALRPSAERALLALHALGIVHNDIYGRNLLVFRDGDGVESVVIVDFDMSEVLEPEYTVHRVKGRIDTALLKGEFSTLAWAN